MILCAGLVDPARQPRQRAPQADAAGVRRPDPRVRHREPRRARHHRARHQHAPPRRADPRASSATAARFGARITYIDEPAILGTGGGLKHALPLLDPDGRDEPFLSINGKLIFDLDITALVAAYRARRRRSLGMMVVRRVPDAKSVGRGRGRGRRPDHEHPRRRRAHVLRRPRHAAVGDGAPARRRVRLDPPGLPAVAARGRAVARVRARATATSPSTRRRSATSSRTGRCSPARRCAIRPASSPASIRRRASHPTATDRRAGEDRRGRDGSARTSPSGRTRSSARVRVVERSIARTVVWAGATANAANAGEAIVT